MQARYRLLCTFQIIIIIIITQGILFQGYLAIILIIKK